MMLLLKVDMLNFFTTLSQMCSFKAVQSSRGCSLKKQIFADAKNLHEYMVECCICL